MYFGLNKVFSPPLCVCVCMHLCMCVCVYVDMLTESYLHVRHLSQHTSHYFIFVCLCLWRPEVNVWHYLQLLSILLLLLLLLLLLILLLLLLLLQVLPLNLELIRPASPRDYTSEFHHA